MINDPIVVITSFILSNSSLVKIFIFLFYYDQVQVPKQHISNLPLQLPFWVQSRLPQGWPG